jgi:hypothetical protein
MSDFSRRADSDVTRNVKALEQIHALRGWLTAVLIQTLQAEATIKHRIAGLEQEAQGLRAQLDQTTPAIESLRQTIHSVDEMIRRRSDETRAAIAGRSDQVETERERPVEASQQGARSARHKDRQSGTPKRK